MTNPQQPELRRSEYGGATASNRNPDSVNRDASEDGKAAPTPSANKTEDERRSGKRSVTRDDLTG